MRASRAVGIAGYGAYVPRLRVRTADISAAWRVRGAAAPAVAEKSVPAADEDVVTMAIEAARTALDRAGTGLDAIGAIWVGTESKPYAVKPSATIVAEALGITPHVVAADMEFACKAGSEAMQAAVAFVGSSMVEAALAIGMDTAQSKPGDALEYTAGCGGAAYLFAAAADALAVVEASVSHVTDTPDFFRREAAHYPEHGGRFTGEPSYFHHTLAASRRLLAEVGSEAKDFAHAVFHQPVPKFVEKAAAELGFTRQQIRTGLVAPRMGNAYAGSSLLGLAAVLDVARPGDRIFFCSYGSGAGSDAFSFRVTERIEERRRGPSVVDYLERRRLVDGYGHYLRLRGKIRRS
ncbi:MAG TPA: hydroxymethylglutaryl-CoA synthase [Thermoanaerobaculia bacterium]|jgi:hydroxymethylglutaryl-CoA synthase|nr:hydroxymethylglutaryl-CoA synthase [Thermoanaerobaculia bacterium]